LRVLGSYLSPAKSIGPEMCFHILKPTGRAVQQTTVGLLTPSKIKNALTKAQMADFMTEMYWGPLGNPMAKQDIKDSGDNLDKTPTFPPTPMTSGERSPLCRKEMHLLSMPLTSILAQNSNYHCMMIWQVPPSRQENM
jgi:hypothetical protein